MFELPLAFYKVRFGLKGIVAAFDWWAFSLRLPSRHVSDRLWEKLSEGWDSYD